MERITVAHVEYLAFRLAKEFLSFNEPIPDFTTRVPNKLESCLLAPFQTFDRKDLYPTFVAKAAALFYLIIKDHPFQNGNKRIATTTLFTFLFLNSKWLVADTQEFLNFAVWVALSPPRAKDDVLSATIRFIEDHLKDLPSDSAN